MIKNYSLRRISYLLCVFRLLRTCADHFDSYLCSILFKNFNEIIPSTRMPVMFALTFLTFSLFISLIFALPMKSVQDCCSLPIPKRAAYSVVAVDGSPPVASTTMTRNIETVTRTLDKTKTVTALPTTLLGTTETIISTKLVTERLSASTRFVQLPMITATISTGRAATYAEETSFAFTSQQSSELIASSTSYGVVSPVEVAGEPSSGTSTSSRSVPPSATVPKNTSTSTSKDVSTLPSAMQPHITGSPVAPFYQATPTMTSRTLNGSWHASHSFFNSSSTTGAASKTAGSMVLPSAVFTGLTS